MEKKILFAVDGSEKGFQAVSVMGRLLKDQPDIRLVLFHCIQQMAKLLPGEVARDVEETCKLPIGDQEKIGTAVLCEARRLLVEAGFPEDRIESKQKVDSVDAAQDILAEAEAQNIRTIALGRRGRGQLQTMLLGSVSGKVAQYAHHQTVWIVDAPVHQSNEVLIAMQGATDSNELASYTADYIASNRSLKFTLLHLMPPVPPTFWDDGHILGPAEQKDRESRIEKWKSDWIEKVERFMSDVRQFLAGKGVSEGNISTLILPTKQGIARDLLNEIDEHKFQMVVMGKRSFHERKPFLMGSHANKVLQNVKGVILCLVDD
jgi:nucleotide-binding universal stress UspA family protein